MRHSISIILLLSLLVGPARAQTGPQLTQSVVAGGGGVSAQGSVRVEGTVGQGVAGASTGGAFALEGGFDVTFHAVNERPTANAQSVTTDEVTPVAITLTGADEETPAAGLVFAVTTQPEHGTLSGSAPNLTYTPAGFVGTDSFEFTVTDTGDGTAPPLTSFSAAVSLTVLGSPVVSVHDARAAEPAAGETQMLFAVTLTRAPLSPLSVAYATVAEPGATGKAAEGVDYRATGGTLTFQPGQRVHTVSVPVLRDGAAEPNETFLLQLSNVSGGRLAGGTAVGTITATNPAGAVLISELRTSGPVGLGDEFVEIYNNSDSPVTVTEAGGWGLFKLGPDCDATPVLVGTIPKDTVIPARGNYLFTGSQYSLADYGGAGAAAGDSPLGADIESDRNVGLFKTTDVALLSSLTRLDAVGFGANNQNNCNLLREGTNLGPASGSVLEHSYFRKLCGFVNGVGCQTNGTPLDKQDNATDFTFADTTGTEIVGTGHRLGAPGPQNTDSPRQTNALAVLLLDGSKGGPTPPNRVRDLSHVIPGVSDLGTMSIRRRVVNNTGGAVTRLRFRISEMTTYPQPADYADLRALTGMAVTGVSITGDSGTCGGPSSCTVTVEGTTLEQEPNQPAGGGLNATLTVTLGAPLPAGEDVLIHFLLGVQHSGLFRFFIITEALP